LFVCSERCESFDASETAAAWRAYTVDTNCTQQTERTLIGADAPLPAPGFIAGA
jgi:hypothetical protein